MDCYYFSTRAGKLPSLYYQDILHEKNPNENYCAAFSLLYFIFLIM